MMNRVVGKKSGVPYALDPRALIGRGTEGRVYCAGALCVKVYATALSDDQVEKIEALVRYGKPIPRFAWPSEIVVDRDSGRPVGYAMALVRGENLENLMDGRDTAGIPAPAKVKIALHAARAVADAHAARAPKIALGDVIKAGNLVLSGDTAVFVDAASANLFGYRAASGDVRNATSTLSTPGYVPKEVLENPHSLPSHSADLFALAVVLFELFFGRPPHEPRPCPAAVGLEPDDAIRRGIYPRWTGHPEFDAPIYDSINIPDYIDDMFRATFLSSGVRPPASQWCEALEAWLDGLSVDPAPPLLPWPAPWVRTEAGRLVVVAIALGILAWGASRASQGWAAPTLPWDRRPIEIPSPPRTPVGPPLFKELFQ